MDKYDLPAIINDIKKEMPNMNPDMVGVPCSYTRGMPKNMNDFASYVQNKYLNSHQAEIEEAFYKKILPQKLVQWWANQNFKYHSKSGILNHEGFFTKLRNTVLYGHKNSILGCGFIINPYVYNTGVPGQMLEITTSTSTDYGTGNHNYLFAFPMNAAGDIGDLYDELQGVLNTAAGNLKLGCYDQTTGPTPNNLYQQGAATAATTTTITVTEFSLTDTTPWLAFNSDNSGLHYTGDSTDGITREERSLSYASSMPDPYGATTTQSGSFNGRIQHS